MYSRKSVGPRMDPWGTPALTGYSCGDFPSITTQRCLFVYSFTYYILIVIIGISFTQAF